MYRTHEESVKHHVTSTNVAFSLCLNLTKGKTLPKIKYRVQKPGHVSRKHFFQ